MHKRLGCARVSFKNGLVAESNRYRTVGISITKGRKTMRSVCTFRIFTVTFMLVVFLVLIYGPDATAGPDPGTRNHWGILRVNGLFTFPLGTNSVKAWNDCGDFWVLNFDSSLDIKNAPGLVASFEYVVAKKYGMELSLIYWHKIVDIGVSYADDWQTIEGSPNFIMPVLGFNYHIFTGEKLDFYAGPIIGLGIYATGIMTDIDVSGDTAFGINVGTDYYFRERWFIGGSARYVDFGDIGFSLFPPGYPGIVCNNGLVGIGDMNLMTFTAGVGFRF